MEGLPNYYDHDYEIPHASALRHRPYDAATVSESGEQRRRIDRFPDQGRTGRKSFKLREKLLNTKENRLSPAKAANTLVRLFSRTLKRRLEDRTYQKSPAEFRDGFM